jgi:hypothetical protein
MPGWVTSGRGMARDGSRNVVLIALLIDSSNSFLLLHVTDSQLNKTTIQKHSQIRGKAQRNKLVWLAKCCGALQCIVKTL